MTQYDKANTYSSYETFNNVKVLVPDARKKVFVVFFSNQKEMHEVTAYGII